MLSKLFAPPAARNAADLHLHLGDFPQTGRRTAARASCLQRAPSSHRGTSADSKTPVEQHTCPKCDAQPGSPCRSRGGAVASAYHTRRFTMVPRLNKALRVPTPADRGPGRPWRPGTPPPAPIDPDLPSADIRIGYARCSTLGQELDSLSKHGIPRDKIFRVIFTVYEMKRLGRDAAELTVLADHLTAHGLVLEMLAGPLPGIYDPTGPGKLLFAFFAAMAETERENHPGVDVGGARHRGPQGQARRPAAGHHRRHAPHRAATPCTRRVRRADPARPDHPHRQAQGASPSVASIYRALAEHAKREAYPEAVTQAHADFAALQAGEVPGLCLALPDRASL